MPNGKTHDVITLLLTVPVAAAAYMATGAAFTSSLLAVSFVFGGLMFGPDLDIVSRQYSRWSIFRFLWLPYRSFFKHRSRWSHGLIFGTLIRTVYFMGVVTLAAYVVVCAAEIISQGGFALEPGMIRGWVNLGRAANANLGEWGTITVFAGMWLGAASHTLTDISGTYIKTGRVTDLL
ncbi:MAG: metal-binding protein [Acidobacteriota bacterium]